jgi:hypothetical protein
MIYFFPGIELGGSPMRLVFKNLMVRNRRPSVHDGPAASAAATGFYIPTGDFSHPKNPDAHLLSSKTCTGSSTSTDITAFAPPSPITYTGNHDPKYRRAKDGR